MAKERKFCCTITAPSIINFENHWICQCNVNGHFPIRHWLTLQASDHIPRKCEIWKYVDYHMNIQSILTSNGFSTSPFTYEAVEVILGSIYFYFHVQTAPNLQDCPHSDNLTTFPDFTLSFLCKFYLWKTSNEVKPHVLSRVFITKFRVYF